MTLCFGFKLLREKSTRRNARDVPLLRLPAEIRASIWKHALEYPIVKVRPSSERHRNNVRENFGLLRVCRQVYSETARLPHTLNTFSFSLGDMPHHDMTKLNKVQKLSVETNWVVLDAVCSYIFPLEDLPQLREVEVTILRGRGKEAETKKKLLAHLEGKQVRIVTRT